MVIYVSCMRERVRERDATPSDIIKVLRLKDQQHEHYRITQRMKDQNKPVQRTKAFCLDDLQIGKHKKVSSQFNLHILGMHNAPASCSFFTSPQ